MSQQQTYQAFARLVRIDSRSCSRSRPSPLSSGFQLPAITSMCFGFFGGIASLSLHQDSFLCLVFSLRGQGQALRPAKNQRELSSMESEIRRAKKVVTGRAGRRGWKQNMRDVKRLDTTRHRGEHATEENWTHVAARL